MASCEQTLEAREIVGGTAVVWVGAWDEDMALGMLACVVSVQNLRRRGSFVKAAGKGCGRGGRRI